MLDAFRTHLQESGLIPPGTRVLVGYSGGPDSTALLHLLHSAGIEVVAGHLHHGMRPEADEEMDRCQAFAVQLDVPFVAGRANVPQIAAEMRIGLEEAGREARYDFFRRASVGMECGLIATAHTRSDQAETVLLNIARGCGLRGLAGIPARRDNVVRPLLAFSRDETRAYCVRLGLWTHDDPANSDLSFSRARIRHRVLPEIDKVAPSIEKALERLATIADEEDRFLDGMAAAALERCDVPLNGALRFLSEDVEVRFRREALAHLPAVLIKRALRLACEALGAGLTYEQTGIATAGLLEGARGSVTAEGGEVVVEWNDIHCDVRRLEAPDAFRYPLTVPGETLSDEFGWQFTAYEDSRLPREPLRSELETSLDRAKVKGPLHFRSFEPGDEMQPLGFAGRRKLSDLLAEAKLTQAARERLPIVCDMVGPIWAPGVCVSERVRPGSQSAQVIHLSFSVQRESGWHNIRNTEA